MTLCIFCKHKMWSHSNFRIFSTLITYIFVLFIQKSELQSSARKESALLVYLPLTMDFKSIRHITSQHFVKQRMWDPLCICRLLSPETGNLYKNTVKTLPDTLSYPELPSPHARCPLGAPSIKCTWTSCSPNTFR